MKSRVLQVAFSGGRMGPAMFGRVDDARQRNGVADLLNMVCSAQGSAERRGGFEFIAETKNSARRSIVRPFTYSVDQTLIMEIVGWDGVPLTYGTIRLYAQGQQVQLAGPYQAYRASGTCTFSSSGGGPFTLVCNWTGHPFTADNQPVQFTTTGTLPGDLVAGATYYVRNPLADPNQFLLARAPTDAGAIQIIAGGLGSPTITGHPVFLDGEIVNRSGVDYYCMLWTAGVVPGVSLGWEGSWYPYSGTAFEIPHQYAEADLLDIQWRTQSGDVLTLTHQGYPVRELVRLGATYWSLRTIPWAPTIAAPAWVGAGVTPTFGVVATVSNCSAAAGPRTRIRFASNHEFAKGDTVYVAGIGGVTGVPDGFYNVGNVPNPDEIEIRTVTGQTWIVMGGAYTSGGTVRTASPASDTVHEYRITSVDANEIESNSSSIVSVTNNIDLEGAFNTLAWWSSSGAIRYNIYRRERGLFALLATTDKTTFRDDGTVAPDSGKSLGYQDLSLNGSDYPGAAGWHEQRRVVAGTPKFPLTVWLTRTNTDRDLSFRIPPNDDDRLKVTIAANEAAVIRHVVPIAGNMMVLTNAGEHRLAPVDQEALTPSSASARQLSAVGSSKVQPLTVGSTVLFVGARAGHLHELGYRADEGYRPGDLSLRTPDWFAAAKPIDLAIQKAPLQVVWMVMDDGRVLGMTYQPEEGVAGWHEHTTDGVFESVAVVAEGAEDRVYAIVRRTINGATKRNVERLVARRWSNVVDRRFLDCFKTYDGTNTTAITLTISGGTTYAANQAVTMTASAPLFAYPAITDVGDRILWLGQYAIRITGTTSTTVAQGVIIDSFNGASLGPSTNWKFGRDTITGLGHLEGKKVRALVDGVVHPERTVSGGAITLASVGYRVHVGLSYTSRLTTMPVALQIDGLAHGREKNVNRVWARVINSPTFQVGPTATQMVRSHVPGVDVVTGEQRVLVPGTWSPDGQVQLQQDEPVPLEVVSLAYEVTIGD